MSVPLARRRITTPSLYDDMNAFETTSSMSIEFDQLQVDDEKLQQLPAWNRIDSQFFSVLKVEFF
jgi:hypothetical protein